MSKNAWITLIGVVVVLVSLALVLMLILVPQTKSYITGINYDAIQRPEFTYEDSKYDPQKEENMEKYEVNNSQIKSSEAQDYYDPGNVNPFTPKKDLTIYNEPGYVPPSNSTNGTVSGGNSGSNYGGTSTEK